VGGTPAVLEYDGGRVDEKASLGDMLDE